MGEWQTWVCKNERVPRLVQQLGKYWGHGNGQKSSRTVTGGMVEPRRHGCRHRDTWLWLQETNELWWLSRNRAAPGALTDTAKG